jgi:hypothetical protein
LALTAIEVIGCGSLSQDTSDSQSHWLTCEEQAQCGNLTCECGLCTTTCDADEDCWSALGISAARCRAVESLGCDNTAGTRVCVPDCAGERCVSDVEPSGEAADNQTTLVGMAPPDLVEVRECPEITPTVGLPAQFRTELTEYSGPATVSESGVERIRLVPDAVVGQVVEITNYPTELSELLASGQRFELELESTTEDGGYKGLVVRNATNDVVLAVYHGYDVWYQTGRFGDPAYLGGTLELRMTCQSNIGDACFESQVQSSYAGIFSGDTQVNVDGSQYESVTIGGAPYGVYSWAAGVFGGERLAGCHPDIVQGRTLAFVLYRKSEP